MSIATAIARGVTQGVQGYGENVRRAAIADREEKRFAWEEQEQAEKQRVRDANKAYSEEIAALNEARATGRLAGSDDNLTEEGMKFASGAPRTAVATPDSAPQPAAERMSNPFKSGGEGLYKNQRVADDAYYERLYQTTAKYLSATGQSDKILSLQKQITDMREQGYEPLRKAAAAAVAMGSPNAMQLVSQASQLSGTPTNIDPTSGTFDAKTQTWKGVKIVGPDGKAQVQDIPAQNLLASIGSLDAGKVLEFNFGRADKERQFGLDERKTRADEKRADAYASTARDNAETNRSTRQTNEEIRKRQQEIREDESAAKLFGSAFGVKEIEIKPKDEIEAMLPKQREEYEAKRAEQGKRRELASYAQSLYSLNNREVPPAQISQLIPALQRRLSQGKGADGVDPATGLPFVNFNGKKVLLPKD